MKRLIEIAVKQKTWATAVAALFIFLTLVGSSPARANQACIDVFSSASRLTVSQRELLPSLSRIQTRERWEKLLLEVRSADDLLGFFAVIDRNLKRLPPLDIAVLHDLDLIAIVQKMSPHQKQIVAEFADRAAQRHLTGKEISPVDRWVFPLAIYFQPARAMDFIRDIPRLSKRGLGFQDAYAGFAGLSQMNRTLLASLAHLPEGTRTHAVVELKKQFSEIGLESELMSMDYGQLQVPEVRTHRRNIEVISTFVLRPSFERMVEELKQAKSEDAIIQAVDRHYREVGAIIGPKRGLYSFSEVVKAAKMAHLHFGKYLNQSDFFIDLYGSFTNGKAAFSTSDIDMKLSNELLEHMTAKPLESIYHEPFSLYFRDMVERNKDHLPLQFSDFWATYQRAERDLGESIFKHPVAKPSDLLTVLYPPKKYTNDAVDFRWYNPITFRLYKDRIVIQLVDLMAVGPQLTEIPLPR